MNSAFDSDRSIIGNFDQNVNIMTTRTSLILSENTFIVDIFLTIAISINDKLSFRDRLINFVRSINITQEIQA
jgi:hypothetical protein